MDPLNTLAPTSEPKSEETVKYSPSVSEAKHQQDKIRQLQERIEQIKSQLKNSK
jgi:hypothetical protein